MRTSAAGAAALGLCLLAGCSASSTGNSATMGPTKAPSTAATPVTLTSSSPAPSPTPSAAGSSAAPPAAIPVLGRGVRITQGYGTARPRTINNGGDPTGVVDDVVWSSWGGAKAIGYGTAYYDPPNKPVADSVKEKATVVAFDLKTCDGTYMYEAIEWYFPESGGKFDPATYLDACSWTWQGPNR